MHGDHIVAVAEDGDDEVDVNTAATAHTSPPPPFLRAIWFFCQGCSSASGLS